MRSVQAISKMASILPDGVAPFSRHQFRESWSGWRCAAGCLWLRINDVIGLVQQIKKRGEKLGGASRFLPLHLKSAT